MQDLTVSLVQTNQFWEDKTKNLEHFEDLLNKHLHCSTDVIVFPEMFHTGFSMQTALLAEEMGNSLGIQWLTKVAQDRDALCMASLIIHESGNFFNRMVAVFPNGDLAYYDKIHLFTLANEDQYFSPGQKRTVIEFKGWSVLMQVCYDLRFPENARNSVLSVGDFEFDAIVYIANWPERRIGHWNQLLPARAIENQCYVLAVNRVGEDANELKYNGSSQIVSAMGEYLLQPIPNAEGVFSVLLNKNLLFETRTKLAFLKDRRL